MAALISLRGDGPWKGRSTRVVNSRGERAMVRIKNGYVSGDGHEIRQIPGWKTILDLTADNNDRGYEGLTLDYFIPVLVSPDTSYKYMFRGSPTATILSLKCFAKPVSVHGFEQVRGRVITFGESDFRRIPIYNASRTELTPTNVEVVNSGGADRWRITLSGAPSAPTATDAAGAGMHALSTGDVVYIEGLTSSSIQSRLDSELNGRIHMVLTVSLSTALLVTVSAGGVLGSTALTAGDMHRVRYSLGDNYAYSPNGFTPYVPNPYIRIDDPDALTIWTVPEGLSIDDPVKDGYVAWVANRQRDYSDDPGTTQHEGPRVWDTTTAVNRSISRRRQKTLPYRLNPSVAGNRLLFAAPGYGCIFQAPVIVPNVGGPAASPFTTTLWSPNGGPGVLWFSNDVHDKPRCLGIPKAALVDSVYTPAFNATPGGSTAYTNFNLYQVTSGVGFPVGSYRIAITYSDTFTGEEGLASEPIAFTIPTPAVGTGVTGYGITIIYMHPGYFMPECLANAINVYIDTTGDGPLQYYDTYPLIDDGIESTATLKASAKYGCEAGVSPDADQSHIFRFINLRLPTNTSPISAFTDPERLAPQSLQMPRGAESFRVVDGIGLGVGHSGTHGNARELQYTFLSALYNEATPKLWHQPDELTNRAFITPMVIPFTPLTDVGTEDGGFGIASKYFPPAYQGVQIFAQDLLPDPHHIITIDYQRNFRTYRGPGGVDYNVAKYQRLATNEDIFNRNIGSPLAQELYHREAYVMLPRGQVQVSEPGRPEVAISTAIQIIDPNKDDDGVAIGDFGGDAVICSKKETYMLTWVRAPQGEVPRLVSNDHGCIATNSMIEFDGGLAWLAERGPVALTGSGLVHVGGDLEEDFYGERRRYGVDSRGMMRHAWGAHDKQRGLVYFGLVTNDSTHTITWENASYTFATAPDNVKSRFPCNEVLIWSYRANAFSYWTPPSGLEVLWMRPLTDGTGKERMCFLAADYRIYAMDDSWQDSNKRVLQGTMTTLGTGTSLTLPFTFGTDGNGGAASRGSSDNILRSGMTAILLTSARKYKARATISSPNASTSTVTLSETWSWDVGDIVMVGLRPEMEIVTSYAGESADTLDVQSVTARYWIPYEGNTNANCFAKARVIKTDLEYDTTPNEVDYTEQEEYIPIGQPVNSDYPVGHRRAIAEGRATGPEVAVIANFLGAAQVRVTDLMLSVEAME